VPAGPVYDVNQMHEDPQVLARKMVVEVEHARLGPVRTIGLPVKFSDTPGEVASGAPFYGQHTREVLREHGFADDEIESLLAEGAIADR
jgi:crotonobetainyl-CoA:carnitine CoA-transferase CaiB-like acyl-CoA transferase